MGADTSERSGGGGALQLLDLRLLEDGSERGNALDSDVVLPETASEAQDGNGERVGVSMGADRKANTRFEHRAPTPAIAASNCRAAP